MSVNPSPRRKSFDPLKALLIFGVAAMLCIVLVVLILS